MEDPGCQSILLIQVAGAGGRACNHIHALRLPELSIQVKNGEALLSFNWEACPRPARHSAKDVCYARVPFH
jgi:hypothetical protein